MSPFIQRISKAALFTAALCFCSHPSHAGGSSTSKEKGDRQEAKADLQEKEPIHWYDTHEAAFEASKKDGKPVFMLFTGSDWCHWCIKLEKEILADPAYMELGGRGFHHLYIDSPRYKALPAAAEEANASLREKYDIQGYPTVIIADCEGVQLAEAGYTPGGAKAFFKEVAAALAHVDAEEEEGEGMTRCAPVPEDATP